MCAETVTAFVFGAGATRRFSIAAGPSTGTPDNRNRHEFAGVVTGSRAGLPSRVVGVRFPIPAPMRVARPGQQFSAKLPQRPRVRATPLHHETERQRHHRRRWSAAACRGGFCHRLGAVGLNPMGRPSSYSIETAAEICARIAEGRSIRTICKDEDMPDAKTVFRWLGDENNEEFRQQYARACETRSHAFAEDIIEIADDGTEDPQRSKLRVDARKWLASKMLPKKYGDKVAAEFTGKDGEPLMPAPSENEVARRVAHILNTAIKAREVKGATDGPA